MCKILKTHIFLILSLMVSTSCATSSLKTIDQVNYHPKPTQEEAASKIHEFLETHLIDPTSPIVKCSDVSSEGYVWTGIGYPYQYGYIVMCSINAKNRFGGYAGSKRYVFLFNGPEFEHIDVVCEAGLMDGSYREFTGRVKKDTNKTFSFKNKY